MLNKFLSCVGFRPPVDEARQNNHAPAPSSPLAQLDESDASPSTWVHPDRREAYIADVKRLAKAWGTTDLRSVERIKAIFSRSSEEVPLDPGSIYLHRNMSLGFLDADQMQVFNNPNAEAKTEIGHVSGLNFLVNRELPKKSVYGSEVNIVCTLKDVLDRKGGVLGDYGAAVESAILVHLPEGVGLPFSFNQNIELPHHIWEAQFEAKLRREIGL